MRRIATAVFLTIATLAGAAGPAQAQRNIPPVDERVGLTPLGWYALGSMFCAAATPIIGTIVLGRELTANEVGRSTLSCFLGPVGWLLAEELFPDRVTPRNPPPRNPPRRVAGPPGGPIVSIPPPRETRYVRNEVLIEFDPATPPPYVDTVGRRLQLTRLETQTFTLTGRTVERWRIDGGASVVATLRGLSRYRRIVMAQPNELYILPQSGAAAAPGPAQYVVPKLHLLEAHKIANGDDVVVAVIDSKIDAGHPDLAGVIADQYDAIGTAAAAHSHGTGMAGAIAAHVKLIGIAPKVKLLAVRAFAGAGESAQGTTYNIMKGLDWAARKNAQIFNMSFAGPPDPMIREMLGKAYARGIVLIAAVGNAGPRSPPLYPAADPDVIGVTATDAEDKLLPQANRGPQVAVAAPGVEVLVPAPDATYALTTGTSVAAAHASGVAALLLSRDPKLTPDAVRRDLIGSARAVPGSRRDVGAGVIDALAAVNSLRK